MSKRFRDRTDAGRQLGDELAGRNLDAPLVLGLPRGGVPVAAEVADRLGSPLDVVVVRKIGAPTNPEYALGAIGEGGVEVLNEDAAATLGLDSNDLSGTIRRERQELNRRVLRFRGERGGLDVTGRTVIVVDDGIATGSTALAASQVLRARGAARVVLAVPVAPPRSLQRLADHFDDVVALSTPRNFRAVGSWYDTFGQISDDEVERVLTAHHQRSSS